MNNKPIPVPNHHTSTPIHPPTHTPHVTALLAVNQEAEHAIATRAAALSTALQGSLTDNASKEWQAQEARAAMADMQVRTCGCVGVVCICVCVCIVVCVYCCVWFLDIDFFLFL